MECARERKVRRQYVRVSGSQECGKCGKCGKCSAGVVVDGGGGAAAGRDARDCGVGRCEGGEGGEGGERGEDTPSIKGECLALQTRFTAHTWRQRQRQRQDTRE